jgi:hypothetical protein
LTVALAAAVIGGPTTANAAPSDPGPPNTVSPTGSAVDDPALTAGSEEKTGDMSAADIAAQAASPGYLLKVAAFDAWRAQQAGRVTADDFRVADDAYYRFLGIANPMDSPAAQAFSPSTATEAQYILSVQQVGQQQSNWCGPASAYEMMSYHNAWTSQYGSHPSLSQSALAGPDYTNAGATGGTDWVDFDMRRAVNRWRFGSDPNGYVQVTPASSGDLWSKVSYDIIHYWPVAQDMTEVYNGPHYNNHPNRQSDIKHWTVSAGVWVDSGYGDLLYIADSSTTVFVNAQPYFWYGIADAYARMTSPYTRGIVW